MRNERDTKEGLPPEYRRRRESPWFWVAGVASLLVAIFAGAAVSRAFAAFAAVAAVAPFLAVVIWHDRQHRKRIIDSVRARAGTLDPAEFAKLVDALEEVYGREQMRELRELPTT